MNLPLRAKHRVKSRRKIVLRETGKQDFSAFLGNANGRAANSGRIDVPGRTHLYYFQKRISIDDDGNNAMFGPALPAMSGSQIPELHGTPVIVRPIGKNEYKIIGVDANEVVRQGKSPRANNWLSPFNRFLNLGNALPLYVYSIGTTTTPSTEVIIKPYKYRNSDGDYIQIPKQLLDLSPYFPAAIGSDDSQVIACIFVDYLGAVSVVTSTPKLKTDVLNWDDVAECFEDAPIRALAARAYKLYTGQTNVIPADHFGDIREWFPPPQRKNNYAAIIPPTVNDDIDLGYEVGSAWIDTVSDRVYRCTDSSDGAAIWSELAFEGYATFVNIDDTDSPYSIGAESTVIADTTAGDIIINLPAVALISGRQLTIKNVGAGAVTIETNASETIDKDANLIVNTQFDAPKLMNDGVEWWLI